MVDAVCLPIIDDYMESYICNDKYMKNNTLKSNNKSSIRYEVVSNKIVSCMEDLISYCLTYHYDINIPENYKVDKLYNIMLTTGNFDPDSRSSSNCHSSIVLSSFNADYINKKFNIMCKLIGKPNLYKSKNTYCWQTEDFADNQIVHSYNLDESYVVTKIEG